MNERIKKIRKALDLTQSEFAARLGMKQNTIATYEMGRSNPSTPTINNICKEFRVNEEWLRTGNGDMFKAAPADALDALIEQYGLPHEIRILAEKFMALKPDAQEVVINYVRDTAAAISAAAPATDQGAPPPWEGEAMAYRRPATEEEKAWARAEAEAYYRELLLEKKAPGGSSASPSGSDGGTKGA